MREATDREKEINRWHRTNQKPFCGQCLLEQHRWSCALKCTFRRARHCVKRSRCRWDSPGAVGIMLCHLGWTMLPGCCAVITFPLQILDVFQLLFIDDILAIFTTFLFNSLCKPYNTSALTSPVCVCVLIFSNKCHGTPQLLVQLQDMDVLYFVVY